MFAEKLPRKKSIKWPDLILNRELWSKGVDCTHFRRKLIFFVLQRYGSKLGHPKCRDMVSRTVVDWNHAINKFSTKKLPDQALFVWILLLWNWIFPLKSLKIVFIMQFKRLFILPLNFPSTNSVGAEFYSVWEVIHYMWYSFREFRLSPKTEGEGYGVAFSPKRAR